MMAARPTFTCPDCKLTSYKPKDVKNSYCGACEKFFPVGTGFGPVSAPRAE
jgi:hypothetical protein